MAYIFQARQGEGEEKVFEGPLDLLLELIEKNKLDITDISLAEVADQFIGYMQDNSEDIGPEHLAEFLLIAGKLVLIKSKAILPLLELEKEEEEDIEALKRRLREYKRFKEIFPAVRRLYEQPEMFFSRGGYTGIGPVFCPPANLRPEELEGLFALAITRIPVKEEVRETRRISKISITEKINTIKESLRSRMDVTFRAVLAGNKNKLEVIVTFLAMLEMVRKNQASVDQEEMFGEICIKKL